MDKKKRIALLGVVGSTAYGLNHAGSDIDQLGVYVEAPSSFLGLSFPKQTYVYQEPDTTMHEIGKFISLALKCNPTVLELLWLDDYLESSYWGRRLVSMRTCFLSEDYVRNAFGGYAVQQARRLERRNAEGKDGFASDVKQRTAKHARHCFRLLRQGAELLATGDMTLKVPNPAELFELGELPVPQIVERFEDEFVRFERIESVLPTEPAIYHVERFLTRLRKYSIHEEMADEFMQVA